MYHIGIDGGGTHTRVELRSSDNQMLRRESFGPFNIAAIGETAFRQRLNEIIAAMPELNAVRAICIGGAGVSGGDMEPIIRQTLHDAGFRGTLLLRGDHEIALAGAIEGAGLVLIAGTGSICCGKNERGNFFRCGGWGHLLDDGGSAYALGRDALSAALQTEDGRLNKNALHRAVFTHLNASGPRDLIHFAYHSAGKAEIATLAPLVIQAAEAGDSVAAQILETQAKSLALLAETTAGKLHLQTPKLALLGGLLEHENCYSARVRDILRDIADIVPPAHDALWGAAELAKEASHAE